MATVYSLICWGGKTGKAVTADAATARFTLANHGLRIGTELQIASGAVPSGGSPVAFALNTSYFTRPYSTSEFTLHVSLADATDDTGQLTFTDNGANLSLKSKMMLDYLAEYPGRWGSTGSERCYDGLGTWVAGRAGALPSDREVCEIGEAFTQAGAVVIAIPGGEVVVETRVAGVRTPAFHAGKVCTATTDFGFVIAAANYQTPLRVTRPKTTIDGFSSAIRGAGVSSGSLIGESAPLVLFRNMIALGRLPTYTGETGFSITSPLSGAYNCIAIRCTKGFQFSSYINHTWGANCLAVKCTTGFTSPSAAAYGHFYNNIAVGNTTNWASNSGELGSAKNVSPDGSAWTMTSDFSDISVGAGWNSTDPLFMDYANDDFRLYRDGSEVPSINSALLIDTAYSYYGILPYDIADAERPSYNNGGAEAGDIGCYEFDRGFGPHPASTTVTFVGVNAGSEVRVFNTAGIELAGVESSSANPVLSWILPIGDVTIKVVADAYVLIEFTYSSIAGAVALPIQQALDRWYSNP